MATTRQFTADLQAPEDAVCSLCGAKAVLQCSCCDNSMCLLHAVPFVPVNDDKLNVVYDYVECQSCSCGEQDDLEPAEPGGD
jgi:hypothetical protein